MSNIAIKGADTGTGVFTLESPATNTDRTLVLPDEAGTVLTSVSDISSAQLTGDAIPLGVGQTWQNVGGSRAFDTTYTNTTGRPIVVTVGYYSQTLYTVYYFTINGLQITIGRNAMSTGNSGINQFTTVIPSGATYAASGGFINEWYELR